jgi:thioredoxin-like negative regulator of GroEL
VHDGPGAISGTSRTVHGVEQEPSTKADEFPAVPVNSDSRLAPSQPELDSESIPALTEASYDSSSAHIEAAIGAAEHCMVLFTVPWCGVDRHLRSELGKVGAGRDDVFIVDCNANPHVADRYRIDIFPTILVLERGNERGRKIGAVGRTELEDLLAELSPTLPRR